MHLIIFLLQFIIGYSVNAIETIDEAFRIAGCLAKCKEELCQNKCYQNQYSQDLKNVSITANFNASLYCKDINFLRISHNPGIFVIEQSQNENNWTHAIVSNGNISSFLNLLPGQRYRYRAHRVTEDGISSPELSEWFETTRINVSPRHVEDIFVKDIIPENKDSSHLRVDIGFNPAEDRSCFYTVLAWTQEDGLSTLNVTEDFKFSLRDLNYLEKYNVIIFATNQGINKTSENVTYTFTTPSCLDVHKNLSICPPDSVQNLDISNVIDLGDKFNFTVSWDEPEFLPDNYTIQIMPLDGSNDPYFTTVSGQLTETSCFVEKNELLYVVSIVSESPGGTSTPMSIIKSFSKDNTALAEVSIEIIILPAIGIVILVIAVFCIYCRRNKSHNIKIIQTQMTYKNNLKESINQNPIYDKFIKPTMDIDNKIEADPLITKDPFEINPSQLLIKDVLGSGISGVVRLGILKVDPEKSINVAVKMLKDCPTTEEIRNFQQEILIMKSAGIHPNIVSLIGCCTTYKKPMLVVEYCSKGDLQSYLRNILKDIMNDYNCKMYGLPRQQAEDNPGYLTLTSWHQEAVSNQAYDLQEEIAKRSERITTKDLLSFAKQVANGMEFLSLNRIVHRDLAARNVLVCADMTIKISDFGLSRDVYRESVYKKESNSKLPIKWMAIEALTHQIYTTQSDVWSFGILLWEIVTLGCNPYPEIPTNMILQYLKSGKRMEKPTNCGTKLYDIMNACWRAEPKSRPTFTELKHALDKLLQTATQHQHEYINLENDLFLVPNARDIIE